MNHCSGQVAGFEVVLFSSKSSLDMASLAQQIDVVGFKKKLFLHNCNFKNGLWVKVVQKKTNKQANKPEATKHTNTSKQTMQLCQTNKYSML